MGSHQKCYNPAGIIDTESLPCNTLADQSACCLPNDACLSNGMCFGTRDGYPNVITRSSCTDKTFSDEACPHNCVDVNPNGASIMLPVTTDSNNSSGEATYCCGAFNSRNDGKCNEPTRGSLYPFPVENANVITNRTDGTQQPLNLTGASQAAQATVTITVVSATPTVTQTESALPQRQDNSRVVSVGAGVGVTLGVLLLITCLLLAFQMKRRKRLEQQDSTKQEPDQEQQPQPETPRTRGRQSHAASTPRRGQHAHRQQRQQSIQEADLEQQSGTLDTTNSGPIVSPKAVC